VLCPTIDVIASPATHADAVSIAGAIAALGSPMQASSYVAPTTPPTVVQIRQEMDANSTKLANCDVLTSTRLAASGYTTPPTVAAIQAGMATHADITALGSPMQASSYVAPTTPPTVVQIRQEMDANSTKLANCDVLTSTRLAASGYTTPPTVAAIQSGLATHQDIVNLGTIGGGSGGQVTGFTSTALQQLTGQSVVVQSPMTANGKQLQIVIGDSYTAANGQSLSYVISGQNGLIGSVPHLRIDGYAFDIATAPAITSGSQTVTFNDIPATITNRLSPGTFLDYQIRHMNGTDVISVVRGKVTIIKGL
jgi:hypothetical protein